MIRLTAIMSGGQTGADRGALDAAIQLGLGWGGWAPRGWRAEDGEIPAIYREHMRESSQADYKLRTRLNIQDTDGTLIVSFGNLTGGSEYTAQHARHQKKPCKHLQLVAQGETRIPEAVRSAILAWVDDNRISTMNVAGPSESKEPGIQQAVRDALVWVFEDEVVEPATPLTAEQRSHLADIDAAIEAYYRIPGNEAGGSLHVVLDDGNIDRVFIEGCLTYAIEKGDADGERLARSLLALSDVEIEALLGEPGHA